MRRLVKGIMVWALIALCGGALSLAADAPQATVGDLVKLIASSKKMKVEEVESFLGARGFVLGASTLLTERIAAGMFGTMGLRMAASQDRSIRSDQLGRLGTLASFVSLEARAVMDDLDPSGAGDGSHGTDEVHNVGKKTRAGGVDPNSNANVNAFENIREDAR